MSLLQRGSRVDIVACLESTLEGGGRARVLPWRNCGRATPQIPRQEGVAPVVPCLRHNPRPIAASDWPVVKAAACDKSFFCRTGPTLSTG
jgi:hypothetical protein